MRLIRTLLLLLLVLLAGCAGINQQADQGGTYRQARETSRTIDLTNPPADVWERIRRGFAIPNLNDDLSRQWTAYYASHPEAVQRMAQRASKYLYFIVDEIKRRGLPTELALLPFVESAYKPTAQSSAQASGLWQFVPATGQRYNLKQDWWRDERLDPIASTNAALDYLSELFDMQGDWYLALASYNWGENAVQRAIAHNQSLGLPTDYQSLDMPAETRNYVPKLQAIKNIIANPAKYAITLPPVENTPYFAMVSEPTDMDVEVAAQLAEMPLDEFKALNPAYKRPVIGGKNDNSTLVLPTDKVEVFTRNFANYQGRLSSWRVYQPERGERVAAVAKKLGISEVGLRKLNGISPRTKVVSGQKLLVPAQGVNAKTLVAMASADGELPPVARPARTVKVVRGRKIVHRRETRGHKVYHGRPARVATRKVEHGKKVVVARSRKEDKHGRKIAVASAHKGSPSIGHIRSRDDSHDVRVASASGNQSRRPH